MRNLWTFTNKCKLKIEIRIYITKINFYYATYSSDFGETNSLCKCNWVQIPFLLELFVGILKRIFCFYPLKINLALPCLGYQDSFEPVLFQPINWAIHKLLWLQRVYKTTEVNHRVFDANSIYQIIKDIAFHKMYFSSIFWCSCMVYLAESSHFRGGIITWKPAENNQVRVIFFYS